VADREQELFLGHHKHYLEYEKTCREEEDEEERETMETWRHVVTKMDSSYLSAIQTVVAECFATGRISWIPWCGRYVQFAAAVLKVAVGEIPYIYSAMGKPVCVSDTAVANLTAYERILAISQPTLEPVEAEDLELAKRIEDVEAFVSGKLKIFPQCSSQVNTLRIRGDAVAETVHTVVKRQQFYQGKGACYLYLFPYRQRSAVFRKLGRFALLEDVVDQLRKRRVKLDDRHQMLWFNKQKHANVVKANNHSLERQVNYAVKVNPKAQIGGDDEEDATCCYCGMLSCQCGEEYPAGNGLRVGGDSDCWKALIFGEGEDMMLLSDLEKAWIEAWDTGDPEELERNLITTMIDYHIRDDGVMHVVDTMSVNSSTFEKLERRMKLYLEKGYKHLKEFFDEGRKVRLEERMVKGAGTCWMKLQPVAKIPGVSLSDPNTWAVKLTQVLDALRAVDGKVMAIFLKVTFDEVLDLHLEDVQMVATPTYFAMSPERREMRFGDYLGRAAFIKKWEVDLHKERLVGSSSGSALDNAMALLRSPDNQQQAEGFMFGWIGEQARAVEDKCPWAIPKQSRDRANDMGVPWSIRAVEPHGHPLHAYMRRDSYEEAMKYWVGPTTIMFMRPENFNYVRSKMPADHDLRLANSITEVKDIARYHYTFDPTGENPFNFPKCSTAIAHWDEAGHFKSPNAVAKYFKDNEKLRIMTVVHNHPLENLYTDRPTEPTFCNWKEEGDQLIVYPENDRRAAYFQPRFPALLLTRTIRVDDWDMMLYCSVVWSREDTFLQVITRYRVEVPKYLPTNLEVMMPVPRIFRSQPKCGLIPVTWWVECFKYLKTITKPTPKDVWAKIRQLAPKQQLVIDEHTAGVFEKAILHAATSDYLPDLQTKHYGSFWASVGYRTFGHFQRIYNRKFKTKYAERWGEMISTPNSIGLLPLANYKFAGQIKPDSGVDGYWKYDDAEAITLLQGFKHVLRRIFFPNAHVNAEVTIVDGEVCVGPMKFAPMTERYQRKSQLAQQTIMDLQAEDYFHMLVDTPEERAPGAEELVVINGENPPDPEDKRKELHALTKLLEDGSDVETAVASSEDSSSDDDEDTDETVSVASDFGDKLVASLPRVFSNSSLRLDKSKPELVRACGFCDKMFPMMACPDGSCKAETCVICHSAACPNSPKYVEYEVETKHRTSTNMAFPAGPVVQDVQDVRRITKRISLEEVIDKASQDEVITMAPDNTGDTTDELQNLKKLWRQAQSSYLRKVPTRMTGQFFGGDIWDRLFPATMGRRFQRVPFKNITEAPKIEYPDEDCLLGALEALYGKRRVEILADMTKAWPSNQLSTYTTGLSRENLIVAALANHWTIRAHYQDSKQSEMIGVRDQLEMHIYLKDNHWRAGVPKKGMPIFNMQVVGQVNRNLSAKVVQELSKVPAVIWKDWLPEYDRLDLFMRAMIDGTTGLLGKTGQGVLALKAALDAMGKMKPIKRQLAVIEGDPGCRKSSGLQKVLRNPFFHQGDAFKVILPTNTLREDWANKLDVKSPKGPMKRPTPGWYVTTFETAFSNPHSARVMIMDEHKFSKGYLPLLAYRFPNATHFILLGDRHQCQKHEVNPDCKLNNPDIMSEGQFYAAYNTMFIEGTYRFGGTIANILRMPSWYKGDSKLFFTDAILTSHLDLKLFYPQWSEDECMRSWMNTLTVVPSEGDVLNKRDLNLNDTVTFAGSQGLDAKICQLILTPVGLKNCDISTIYTAFTRAPNVIIVLQRFGNEEQRACVNNPLLNVLCNFYFRNQPMRTPVKYVPGRDVDVKLSLGLLPSTTKRVMAGEKSKCVNYDAVSPYYPPDQWDRYIDPDTQILRGGHGMLSEDDPAYEDDANFRKFIPEVRVSPLREEGIREEPIVTEPPKTHLLRAEQNDLDERVDVLVEERYDRELVWKDIYSDQFPDGYKPRVDAGQIRKDMVNKLRKARGIFGKEANREMDKILKERADADNPTLTSTHYLNWGALQSVHDEASMKAGIAQRIRRADYDENYRDWQDNTDMGDAMFDALRSYCNWPDDVPFDEREYEECRAEFSARRAERSQTLKKSSAYRADPNFTAVLMGKAQLKLKGPPEHAKGLQTIYIKSDEYLFKLGGIAVYLLKKILAMMPENVYLHAKKSLQDMMDWFAKWDPRTGTYVDLDIKGFDGTQRGASLQYEMKILRFFNVPEDLIDFYLHDKLSAQTRTLFVGLMRLSGELFTWLFNTMFMLGRTLLKYDIPKGDPMAGSGDDIQLFREYAVRQQWLLTWEAQDICEEKRNVREYGSFCAWLIRRGMVVKNPEVLYMRLMANISRGKLMDVIKSYAIEFMTLYTKKDYLYEILDENQMQYLSFLNVFFHNTRRWHGIRLNLDFSTIEIDRGIAHAALSHFLEVLPTFEPLLTTTVEAVGSSAYTAAVSYFNNQDD